VDPTQLHCDADASVDASGCDSLNLPISADAHWNLGIAGTLGGSVGAGELDASDPDSNIPNEPQVSLSSSDQGIDDTLSFDPNMMIARTSLPSPGRPPKMPLPSPKASTMTAPVVYASVVNEDDDHAYVEDAGMFSEDDTKKSFDFTGELQKLNESGGSHRLSFVEQLENAFRTPAAIDLRYDFQLCGAQPLPKVPLLQVELEHAGDTTFSVTMDHASQEFLPEGFPTDVDTEPSLLP